MFIASIIEKYQAEDLLSKTNGLWPARRKMIKVELFYLPLYLFTIKLEDNKGRQYSDMISVDGIKGEFAFFRESDYEQATAEIINKIDFKLTVTMACDIAMQEYKRFLFRNNLKNRNFAKIVSTSQGVQVYYPYWMGYFKHKSAYDFDVIDAVGGSKQGIKMRPVFIDLILQNPRDNKLS